MITLSDNTKGLALLHQVEEIYGKVYTSDSLLEMIFDWVINCIIDNFLTHQFKPVFWLPKELSHRDGSFEYLQHMLVDK